MGGALLRQPALRRRLSWGRLSRALAVVAILFSLAVVAVLLQRNAGELGFYLASADFRWLGASLVLYVVTFVGLALLWHSLISHFGETQRAVHDVYVYAQSSLARRLPGGIWYLAGRVSAYKGTGVAASATLAASAVEFTLVLLSGALLSLLGWLFLDAGDAFGVVQVAGLTVTAILVVGSPRVLSLALRYVSRRQDGVVLKDVTPIQTLVWLGLYTVIWVIGGVTLYVMIGSFYRLDVALLPSIMNSWFLAGLTGNIALFVPSGLGVREVGLTFLLGRVLPTSLAALSALLFRVLLTVGEVLCALIVVATVTVARRLRVVRS